MCGCYRSARSKGDARRTSPAAPKEMNIAVNIVSTQVSSRSFVESGIPWFAGRILRLSLLLCS